MSSNVLKTLIFSRPHVRLGILGLSFASAVLGLMSPYFQKHFIDQLLAAQTEGSLRYVLIAACTALISSLLSSFAFFQAIRESNRLQGEMADQLYTKMMQLRSDSLGKRTTGEIISLYATDIPSSVGLLEQTLPNAAGVLFPILLAPIAIHLIYGISLFDTALVMSMVVMINVILALRQARYFNRFKHLAAERTGLVTEWVQHIRTLKILGWIEEFEKRIFKKREEETKNRIQMVTNGQWMNSISTSITFMINLVGILTLLHARDNVITPGELLAFLWILGVFLARPFRNLPWIFTFGFDAITSARRLNSFLQTEVTSSTASPNAVATQDQNLALKIQDLNLRIEQKQILKNIDLTIKTGELIALVGEVGSGKSSLLLSLIKETGAQFGSYGLFGQNALKMNDEQVRSYFSYVPQEGFAISASLRENIAFEYEATQSHDQKMIDELRLAQFDLAKEGVPTGLDTEIGERGLNLSGGQRQRVGIARAGYFDRPILLLDDSLSAVDVDTERHLLSDLIEGKWHDRTRILITHRLTILPRVDRIIFIDDGQIIDMGTYAELLARSEKFRNFAATILEKNLEVGDVASETIS